MIGEKIKKNFTKVISWMINKLARINYDFGYRSQILGSELFDDLKPYAEIDKTEGGKYFDALEWALANENITNIALTGTYGSGKSSILRSFEKLHPEHRHLKISLASFGSDQSAGINKEGKVKDPDHNKRLIERSILQQIFYTAKPEEIPDSRFKKIYSINKTKIAIYCVLLIVWLISVAALFKSELILSIPGWQAISEVNLIANYLVPTTFFVGLSVLLYKSFKAFSSLSFSKLNIAKGEIELSKDIDSSILNKHLDEILYFFEVNNYNVVVIEDIDRYDDVDIFTKLRELNILLNRSRQVDKRVTFIYALRDELFSDEHERTKFFDFIIPVIPVISSSNSREKLVNKISDAGFKELSSDFISEVSFFITDMRILKNIFNEYIIYRQKLSQVELNQNKLFAIIVYKNLFPEDFSALQNRKGMVNKVFENKDRVIEDRQSILKNKITDLKSEIEEIEKENLNSTKELRRLYLGEFLRQNQDQGITRIRLDNNWKNLDQILEDENFAIFKQQGNFQIRDSSGRGGRISSSFKSIENTVTSEKSYEERKRLIEQKNSGRIERLKQKIEDFQKESDKLQSMKVKELLENISTVELLGGEIANNDLLVLLFRNGYVEEDYQDYISYFYEGALKTNDKNFVRSIKNRTILSPDFTLNNIEEILKKIRSRELYQKAALNYDLVEFLLDSETKFQIHFESLLEQLASGDEYTAKFIDSYIENDRKKLAKFIRVLCKKWNKIWQFISDASGYSTQKKDRYLELIISHADVTDVVQIEDASGGKLTDFIGQKKDFIEFCDGLDDKDKIEQLISKVNVKLTHFNQSDIESKLFNYIYENNFYELNKDTIRFIIKNKSEEKIDNLNRLEPANYTVIRESNCTDLIAYVHERPEYYVKNILLQKKGEIKEAEDYFIKLLNNDLISTEYKVELIKKQSQAISDITSIKNDLWDSLLAENKVDANWDNLITYHSKQEKVSDYLIDFLNSESNYKTLQNEGKIEDTNISDSIVRRFLNDVILNPSLSQNSFYTLVKSTNKTFDSLGISELSKNKVQILINNNRLDLTPENYQEMRKHFSPLYISLVEKNIDAFLDRFGEFETTEKDLKQIFKSSEIDDTAKHKTYKLIDIDQLTIDTELADLLISTLVSNNAQKVPFETTKTLLNNSNSTENKIRLVTSQVGNYNQERSKQLLSSLSSPYPKMVKSRLRPKLNNTGYNLRLAKKLKELNLISSFEANEDDIQVNAKVKI